MKPDNMHQLSEVVEFPVEEDAAHAIGEMVHRVPFWLLLPEEQVRCRRASARFLANLHDEQEETLRHLRHTHDLPLAVIGQGDKRKEIGECDLCRWNPSQLFAAVAGLVCAALVTGIVIGWIVW